MPPIGLTLKDTAFYTAAGELEPATKAIGLHNDLKSDNWSETGFKVTARQPRWIPVVDREIHLNAGEGNKT